MKPQNHTMSGPEWAMLITLSIIWGGAFFFAAVAVTELPPLTVVLARVGIASIALLLTLRILGIRIPVTRPILLAFLGMGILNNIIPFSLLFWSQTHIASGLASILNATTPLFTVVAANFLTSDETLTPNRLIGVLLGICGVAVLMGAPAAGTTLAYLAALGAAASYGLASIYGKRFARLGVPPLATATGQVTASALLMVPIVALIDQPWTLPMPSAYVWLSLLGLALVSTSFAYFLFFRILSTAGATNLSLVTLLIPPSAILLGVLILRESLQFNHFAGMLLIGFGLLAIDGRAFKRAYAWLR